MKTKNTIYNADSLRLATRILSFLTILPFYLFTFLPFLLLTACHHHDEPVPDPTEQTVLFYFPWSGTGNSTDRDYSGLLNEFRSNISEIERAISDRKTMANARLLVCLATRPNDAVLFEIKYEQKVKRDTLTIYSGVDFTQTETILRIISDTKGFAPALHYGLMIGCHGLGWVPVDETTTAKQQEARRRYFGGKKGYRTNISTLAEAIQQSQTHMDFILFDDCYMANVEVAYDLRNVTDYLIASTSEIMARGLPYDQMWLHLSPKPDYQQAVQDFYDFYSTYSYPYGTLAAINCQETESMARLMQEANATHTTASISDIQRLDGYEPSVFFDFGDYAVHLCGDDTRLLSDIQQQLGRLVPYKASLPKIYSMLIGGTISVNTFSGITISDPSLNTTTAKDKEQTAWWKATH